MEMRDKLILYQDDKSVYVHDTKDKLKIVATLAISHCQRALEKLDDSHFISGGDGGYIYMYNLTKRLVRW